MKCLYQLSVLCVLLVDLGVLAILESQAQRYIPFLLIQLFVSISGPVLNQMKMDRDTYQVREVIILFLLQLMAVYCLSFVFQILIPAAMVQ